MRFSFAANPLLDRLSQMPARFRTAASYYQSPVQSIFTWLASSNENTNFTYDLTLLNLRYLASFLSVATRAPLAQIESYLEELLCDDELRAHIRERVLAVDGGRLADPEARYGRRIGWYALVRACRPRVVVETGVDKGLGTCVIAAALRRNAEEGSAGRGVRDGSSPGGRLSTQRKIRGVW